MSSELHRNGFARLLAVGRGSMVDVGLLIAIALLAGGSLAAGRPEEPAGKAVEKPTESLTEKAAPRPLILLTNDDGVGAVGIKAIVAALARVGDVMIVAPARDSSGASQSLKLSDFVRVRKLETPEGSGLTVHAVDGTPATCVYLAVEHLARGRKIDIVVSGINRGQNLGLDLGFSGTVGAARTGAELGLPAIAFSLALGSLELELEAAARRAAEIVAEALEKKLSAGTVLCVNFPGTPAAEWKRPLLTVPGSRGFRLVHELKSSNGPDSVYDPQIVKSTGPYPEGSDTRAVADGHVSVCVLGILAAGERPKPDIRGWRFFQ